MRAVVTGVMAGVLAGCGQAPAQPAVEAPPQVRVARVGSATAPDFVTGTGTIAWRRETSLGFTSAGRIAALRVNEGDTVRGGQMLAALDTTVVGSAVATALAERDRAAAEYRRSAKLLEQGWVTRPRVDNAQAALTAAEANVRSAGFQSRNAIITSPGAGVVLARLSEPGQVVSAGAAVLVIGEAGGGRVLRLPLADRDTARLKVGTPATIRLSAVVGEFTGSVIEIGGRADRATGTFIVEVGLPDDPRLRAGQIGTASIIAEGTGREELLVPPAAVFAPRAGQGFVYVADLAARRVRLRRVSISDATDGAIRVTGGIRRGEWVATSGVDRLADNARIEPLRVGK